MAVYETLHVSQYFSGIAKKPPEMAAIWRVFVVSILVDTGLTRSRISTVKVLHPPVTMICRKAF
jgi:hypothetical protein